MTGRQGSGWHNEPRRHSEAARKGRRPTHQAAPRAAVKYYDDFTGGGTFESMLDTDAQFIEDRLRDGEKKADVEWDVDAVKQKYQLLDRPMKSRFKDHARKNYPRFTKVVGWR